MSLLGSHYLGAFERKENRTLELKLWLIYSAIVVIVVRIQKNMQVLDMSWNFTAFLHNYK